MSLALDAELSEIERVSLRAHVGRCAACAGFERGMEALTRELRTAPLERPAVEVMLPRRRGPARILQIGVAAAAAVVLAAGLGSLAGSLSSRNPVTATTAGASSGNLGALLDRGLDRGIVAMAPTPRRSASRARNIAL